MMLFLLTIFWVGDRHQQCRRSIVSVPRVNDRNAAILDRNA